MKKALLVIILILLVFLLAGCVNSRDIIDNGRVTKSIHARISDLTGGFEEVEVERYSCGYVSVEIYTTDGRIIRTSLKNVILTEKLR